MYQQVRRRGQLGWDGMQSVLRVIGSALRPRNTLSHAAAPAFEMHARTHARTVWLATSVLCHPDIIYVVLSSSVSSPRRRTSKQRAAQCNAARRTGPPHPAMCARPRQWLASSRAASTTRLPRQSPGALSCVCGAQWRESSATTSQLEEREVCCGWWWWWW